MNRRQFLATTTSAAAAAMPFAGRTAFAASGSSRRVRVGMIGTAHPHAQGKLETIRALEDYYELIGVVEPNIKLREACEEQPEYKGIRWLDEQELFATDGLRAVVVETEFAELLSTAQRAVSRGLFVHLDKPPGESLAGLAKLFADADANKVHVQMGYMLRYNPAFEFCFRAVREGWLGRIFELNATMSTLRAVARRKEFYHPQGGAMFDLGSHVIDAAIAILGPPRQVTPFGRKLHRQQDDIVDNQLAVLEYPDAIATIRATFVEPFAGDRRQFVVCGENGTLEIRPLEPPQLRLSLQKPAAGHGAGSNAIKLPTMDGRYHDQLRDFARIVRGEAKPRWGAEHDLAVQKAVLQACGLI